MSRLLEAHCASWNPRKRAHTTLQVSIANLPRIWQQHPPLDVRKERLSSVRIRDTKRGSVPDLDTMVPAVGRWAALVLDQDASAAREALRPLLQHRHARGEAFIAPGEQPGLLVLSRPRTGTLAAWLSRMKGAAGKDQALPRYLLLIGGPDRIPFEVQFLLDQYFLTGRLDVAEAPGQPLSWPSCAEYAQKVVRYESGEIAVHRQGLIYAFATDRPTQDSYQELALPLVAHLRRRSAGQATPGLRPPALLLDDEATTTRLLTALQTETAPALVFTATHGEEFSQQQSEWGALTDAQRGHMESLSVSKIPAFGRFAHGAVLVSFACFSAGVPQRSAHRFFTRESEEDLVPSPFVAELPRVLLAKRHGPVAFLGHVDRVTSSAFTDEIIREGVHPYRDFADWLLTGLGTLGQGLSTIRECYSRTGLKLAVQHGNAYLLRKTPPAVETAWRDWLRFYDFGGFMLLGDPAISAKNARFT